MLKVTISVGFMERHHYPRSIRYFDSFPRMRGKAGMGGGAGKIVAPSPTPAQTARKGGGSFDRRCLVINESPS